MSRILRKGFTLIELLIVIAIIGILTVAFLPTLRGGQSKARDASRVALIGDVSTALEKFIDEGSKLTTDGVATGGLCLAAADYASGVGLEIAKALGRVPQQFPAIKTDPVLCLGQNLFYNNIDEYSYVLAMQVENKENANTSLTALATSVTTIQGIATKAALISNTAGKDGNFYILGRFKD